MSSVNDRRHRLGAYSTCTRQTANAGAALAGRGSVPVEELPAEARDRLRRSSPAPARGSRRATARRDDRHGTSRRLAVGEAFGGVSGLDLRCAGA
jgi:hypothetical protein